MLSSSSKYFKYNQDIMVIMENTCLLCHTASQGMKKKRLPIDCATKKKMFYQEKCFYLVI